MTSKLYRFKFPALFLSIESENVWPSAMATFAVLHVEKDDITITKLLGLVFNTPLFTFFVQWQRYHPLPLPRLQLI
jgi:hypothetical protein